MARALTTTERNLLRSPALRVRVLATFYLDSGTYYFCDDVEDMYNGAHTYIGASSLAEFSEIRSGSDLAAEGCTMVIDGNKFTQAGMGDPGAILRQMLDELYHQRRVDWAFGFAYMDSQEINLTIPAYAGKINTARLIDDSIDSTPGSSGSVGAKLEVVLDSLAMRYNRASFRTRSDTDQREIDPTDAFFSFTADASNSEKSLFWGKQGPAGSALQAATQVAGGLAQAVFGVTRNL